MKKNLYWFTDDNGENACLDFFGTEKQACKFAQKKADELGIVIYVNLCDDIVSVVFPD